MREAPEGRLTLGFGPRLPRLRFELFETLMVDLARHSQQLAQGGIEAPEFWRTPFGLP